ncbi:MAG: hypothetical protein EBZ96_09795 [Synechococcaceae bacterium WB9_3_282]|nr:hypothetical protein [Synechococcaceae bacterium WB9_3_282]
MDDEIYGLVLLQKASQHLRNYSVSGAMGPALAHLVDNPDSPEAFQEVEDCHWLLMQGVSQLLGLKQGIMIHKNHPVISSSRALAVQAEHMHSLWNSQSVDCLDEYTLLAMMLDETIEEFFEGSCQL